MANPGGKSSKQQYLLKAFILVQGINGAMKLAKKRRSEEDNFLYVVPNEHLHDTISKEHIALGHAEITKMLCFQTIHCFQTIPSFQTIPRFQTIPSFRTIPSFQTSLVFKLL